MRHGGETKEKELILSQVGGGMREDRRVRPRTGGRAQTLNTCLRNFSTTQTDPRHSDKASLD